MTALPEPWVAGSMYVRVVDSPLSRNHFMWTPNISDLSLSGPGISEELINKAKAKRKRRPITDPYEAQWAHWITPVGRLFRTLRKAGQ